MSYCFTQIKMKNNSLDYKLLHPTLPVDKETTLVMIYSVSRLIEVMPEGQSKPKFVLDNNVISMGTFDPKKVASGEDIPKSITAVGYTPGINALYLYSTKGSPIITGLPGPIEETTNDELQEIADYLDIHINSQLLVALRDYVLEQP